MDINLIIIIFIICICFLFFFITILKFFKGKKKSKKNKEKTKDKSSTEDEQVSSVVLKPEKKIQKVINAKKLKEQAPNARVKPVFTKEQIEQENREQLEKALEKNKKNFNQQNNLFFPPFFQPESQNMPNLNFPTKLDIKPKSEGNKNNTNFLNLSEVPFPKPAKAEISIKSDRFVDVLKEKGIIDEAVEFGESLVVKDAIETPASKKDMKKKRQKWL